jgi:arginyl-tRNA synthetase
MVRLHSGSIKSINSIESKSERKSALFKLEEDNLRASLKSLFAQAVRAAYPQNFKEISLNECANSSLGDYQFNDAMHLFSIVREVEGCEVKSPREVAQNIINRLPVNPFFENPTVAGPGFINIKISDSYISSKILQNFNSFGRREKKVNNDKDLINPRVVVDFSSPNIAKEMHVGHLRSTIIGDSICRMLEYKNIQTLRLNHVGDWGTQFGMLIEYLNDERDGFVDTIVELQSCYKLAKKRFDEDTEFKVRSQEAVVKLQAGDPKMLEIWKNVCQTSRSEFETIYEALNVKISERGESFYNLMISDILEELEQKNIAVKSEGALCIFSSFEETPLICRKSDGGYNYASTDLAAINHRIKHEKADWIIYVTDSGQKKHFAGIFDAAERAGWLNRSGEQDIRLSHVGFGLVMGEDGKRFRTRSGEVIRLKELLSEAESRCWDELKNRGISGLSEIEMRQTARKLGIGAIKYADLQNNLSTNYVFSFDRMLDLKGNTAIYLQYAHVRVSSVLDKTKIDVHNVTSQEFRFTAKEEKTLALHVLKFAEALDSSLQDLTPSRICDYLYTLCSLFNEFYGSCKVLGDENEESRIIICYATASVMRECFSILGIDPVYKL